MYIENQRDVVVCALGLLSLSLCLNRTLRNSHAVFQKNCLYSVHHSSKDGLLIITYFVFQNSTVQISLVPSRKISLTIKQHHDSKEKVCHWFQN